MRYPYDEYDSYESRKWSSILSLEGRSGSSCPIILTILVGALFLVSFDLHHGRANLATITCTPRLCVSGQPCSCGDEGGKISARVQLVPTLADGGKSGREQAGPTSQEKVPERGAAVRSASELGGEKVVDRQSAGGSSGGQQRNFQHANAEDKPQKSPKSSEEAKTNSKPSPSLSDVSTNNLRAGAESPSVTKVETGGQEVVVTNGKHSAVPNSFPHRSKTFPDLITHTPLDETKLTGCKNCQIAQSTFDATNLMALNKDKNPVEKPVSKLWRMSDVCLVHYPGAVSNRIWIHGLTSSFEEGDAQSALESLEKDQEHVRLKEGSGPTKLDTPNWGRPPGPELFVGVPRELSEDPSFWELPEVSMAVAKHPIPNHGPSGGSTSSSKTASGQGSFAEAAARRLARPAPRPTLLVTNEFWGHVYHTWADFLAPLYVTKHHLYGQDQDIDVVVIFISVSAREAGYFQKIANGYTKLAREFGVHLHFVDPTAKQPMLNSFFVGRWCFEAAKKQEVVFGFAYEFKQGWTSDNMRANGANYQENHEPVSWRPEVAEAFGAMRDKIFLESLRFGREWWAKQEGSSVGKKDGGEDENSGALVPVGGEENGEAAGKRLAEGDSGEKRKLVERLLQKKDGTPGKVFPKPAAESGGEAGAPAEDSNANAGNGKDNKDLNKKTHQVLFLIRDSARHQLTGSDRGIYNMQELVNYLGTDKNFETIFPENDVEIRFASVDDLSFPEQARILFSQISMVIAVHGGGVNNQWLLPPGAGIFEITCADCGHPLGHKQRKPLRFYSHASALLSGGPAAPKATEGDGAEEREDAPAGKNQGHGQPFAHYTLQYTKPQPNSPGLLNIADVSHFWNNVGAFWREKVRPAVTFGENNKSAPTTEKHVEGGSSPPAPEVCHILAAPDLDEDKATATSSSRSPSNKPNLQCFTALGFGKQKEEKAQLKLLSTQDSSTAEEEIAKRDATFLDWANQELDFSKSENWPSGKIGVWGAMTAESNFDDGSSGRGGRRGQRGHGLNNEDHSLFEARLARIPGLSAFRGSGGDPSKFPVGFGGR